MGVLCNCPLGEAIPDVPLNDCPTHFGQLQKIIFQRLESSAGKKNTIADPTKKESWTPLLAAADGTKVVVSPYIYSPETEPGAARTWGGGNQSVGGIEIPIGREPTVVNAMFIREQQATITALKQMQCEGALGIYMVNENGEIGLLCDNPADPKAYSPIDIYGLFVGDLKLGGLEEPDSNSISFKLKPNWSDNFVIVKPSDFNALDLKKAV